MTFNRKAWCLKNKEYLKQKRKEHYLKNKEYENERNRGYYLKNKEHISIMHKKWDLKNKERIKHTLKEWRLKNPEYQREYHLKNPEYQREYHLKNPGHYNEWQRNKAQNDPNFRLIRNLRGRLYKVLKGYNKSASTMKLIGCTIDELWDHLESKFESWMTRENYGEGGWDVDHIKACSEFDQTDPEQQRICFHWSNLQPMEHIANIKKGGR